MAIQKLNAKKHWVTISGSITRTGGIYGKTIRIRRGGSYRVYAGASGGTFAPGAGARSASTRARPSTTGSQAPARRNRWHSCYGVPTSLASSIPMSYSRGSCWHSRLKSANARNITQPLLYGGQ